jgi:signal transduction histidine kinase
MRSECTGDLTGTWDADRLLQVVSNLVANAGHHGTPGEEIRVSIDGVAEQVIVVSVQNAGTIAPQVLPHLFNPFRTTRMGRDRSGGLGLGLFIVQELVRAHGGTVEVVSEAGATSFTVRLPRHAPRALA